METLLTLIKGDKHGAETDYRDNLPVNMIPVDRDIYGVKGYMYQMEGLTQYGTGQGTDRAGFYNERFEQHYRVSGGSLVRVDTNGTVTVLGAISGTDRASMPYSFNTQGIVADGRFWLYSPSGGFSEVTDPDLGNPIDGVWIDGLYCFTDGEYIYHTDAGSESSIDPLKFATAEFMPDKSLGCGKTQDNKWIVFGRYTTEYFINQASANFQFTRVPTRAIKVGIVGTHAKVELSGRWYLLGGAKEDAPTIMVLGVGEAQKVATREIDKIIATYTEAELASSVLESRVMDGQAYVLIRLPNHTLQYCETIAQKFGLSHAWTILQTGVDGLPWRGANLIYEPKRGQWVCGDIYNSNIGYLDATKATQYGDIAEWLLFTPMAAIGPISLDQLEIQSIPGFTGTADATCFLSITYDGVTFGTEWIQLYGNPGSYGQRFILRCLGYVSDVFGVKLRGASRSRMAFSAAKLSFS